MFDVDRAAVLGGGSGSAHDGKVYLDYDVYSGALAYLGSFLQPITSGGLPLSEIQVSDSTSAGFHGYQIQPVAGIADGQIYLMANAVSLDGLSDVLVFHEVAGAGASIVLDKSSFQFPPTGQQLGTSWRFGWNAHRPNGPATHISRSGGYRPVTLH